MGTRACIALGVVAMSSVASAAVYDLRSDFSETANPNGPWSFSRGNQLLVKCTSNISNALNPVASNGFWGTGPDSNYETSVFKLTGDGASASGYTNADFLLGDILVHGSNPGHDPLLVTWTAPEAGSLLVAGQTWYAHSVVNRSQDFSLALNAAVLASGSLTSVNNRTNAIAFNGGGALLVAAGDQLVFSVTPTQGQQFASLAGVNITVDFTPVPAPAGAALLGMGGIIAARRRRA